MACITEACALLAWGYAAATQPTLEVTKQPLELTAYHQTEKCNELGGNSFVSGCQNIGTPKEYLERPCKNNPNLECTTKYTLSKHTDWGDVPKLPPVTVQAPKQKKKVAALHPADKAALDGSAAGAASTGHDRSVPEKVAIEVARYGIVTGAQMGVTAVLAATPLAPAAPIAGPWIGCAVVRYNFTYQDFAQKERWDLHPEIAANNRIYWAKMCSPIGFFFRMQEATTPFEKMAALSGGLTYFADPAVNLVGQIGPIVPAAADNLKSFKLGSLFPFIGSSARKPYHIGEWEAR